MKILATSDLHIHDYRTNTEFVDGLPKRLLLFENLAKDIIEIVRVKNIDLIVVAGDLVRYSTARPAVHNVVKKFFEILSEKRVLVTDGQHDLDTKSDLQVGYNSVVNLISDVKNVDYIHDGGIEVGDTRFWLRGWVPVCSTDGVLDNVDVFIGHGLVTGATTFDKHIFQTGYDSEELSRKFRLSIIGDIHNSQILHGNVILPGSPIQHNFHDSPNTGVYVIDLPVTGNPVIEFISIKKAEYPQFLYADRLENVKKEKNIFYKQRAKEDIILSTSDIVQEQDSDEVELKSHSSIILDLSKTKLAEYKCENTDLAMQLLDKYLASTTFVDFTEYPCITLQELSLNNILSIKSHTFKFEELSGNLLVQGSNGVGKTSLLEALSWVLYGKFTKQNSVDDIVNDQEGKNALGKLKFSVVSKGNSEDYIIVRTRKHDEYGSSLWVQQGSTKIQKDKLADTQEFINDLIKVDYNVFTTLVYFSQKKFSFFNDLTASYQIKLLKNLVDFDIVEEIQAKVATDFAEVKSSYDLIKHDIESFEAQIVNKKNSINELTQKCVMSTNKEAIDGIIGRAVELSLPESFINALKNITFDHKSLHSVIENLSLTQYGVKLSDLITNINNAEAKVDRIKNQLIDCRNSMTLANNSAEIKSTEYDNVKQGMKLAMQQKRCYMCEQVVSSDNVIITKLLRQATELDEELKSIKVASQKATELSESLMQKSEELKAKLVALKKVKSDLDAFEDLAETIILVQEEGRDAKVQMDYVKGEVVELEKKLTEKKSKLVDVEGSKTVLAHLEKVFSGKGIIGSLLIGIGRDIQTEVNRLLSNSPLKVKVNTTPRGKGGGSVSGIKVYASVDGSKMRPYNLLSGGQSRIVDMSLMIVLNNLLCKKYNVENGIMGILILDEVLNFFDQEFAETASQILEESVANLRMVISHDEKLLSFFEKIIPVKMSKGETLYGDLIQ